VGADDYEMILQGADRKRVYGHLRERGHAFLLDDGMKKALDGVTSLDQLRGMGGLSAYQTYFEREERNRVVK